MNINLHNYEEYFLLYADKELSREERVEIEQFIQQYPELEEEFDMINSTIMEPETTQLKDKSFLFKSTGTEFINESNYEEIFVLYHDGELSNQQKEQANKFLNEHPELHDEFLLISMANFQADSVSFPDKKSLLRKEHSGLPGRIIMFRSLAAAAVIGFGLWTAAPYIFESDHQQLMAQKTTSENPVQKNTTPIISEMADNSVATIEKTENQVESKSEEQTEKTGSIAAATSDAPEIISNNKKETILKKVQNKDNLNQKENSLAVIKTKEKKEKTNEVLIAQIPSMEISANDMMNRNELAHVDVNITPDAIANNYPVQNTVYLDVNKEPSGNYIFYNVPEEEFRKTKIGGFLKKLKRVIERNDPIKRLFEGEEGQVASTN